MKHFFPQNLKHDENINMLKETLVEHGIPTSAANNVKKLVIDALQKTCAGFSIERRKEDFETFLFFVDENGPKQGAKKYQEYIESRTMEFIEFFEKYPAKK